MANHHREGWESGWAVIEAEMIERHVQAGMPWEDHVDALRAVFVEYCREWNQQQAAEPA